MSLGWVAEVVVVVVVVIVSFFEAVEEAYGFIFKGMLPLVLAKRVDCCPEEGIGEGDRESCVTES